MTNNPLISVIVPVYNTEKYIRDSLDSILAQTYTNLEVIVINDGSKDMSEEIIQEYVAKDNRVKYFEQENLGQSAARNKGIEIAKGKYIAFIDSDDVIGKNMMLYLVNAIIETGTLIAECQIKNFSDENLLSISDETNSLKSSTQIYSYEELYDDYNANVFSNSPCNKLYDSTLMKQFQFEVGKTYEDSRLMYKVFFAAKKLVFVDYIGYYYRYNPTGITKSTINKKIMDFLESFPTKIAFFKEQGWTNHVSYLIADYARRALLFYARGVKEKVDKELLNIPKRVLLDNKKLFLNNPFKLGKTKLMLRFYYLSPKLFCAIYYFLKRNE